MKQPNRENSERHVRPAGRSLLNRWQRGWLVFGLALAAFMLANTVYLLVYHMADLLGWRMFATSELAISRVYQVMVLSHTGVGLLMAALLGVFFVWHLPTVWRRMRTRTLLSGVLLVAGGGVLTVTGLFILTAANSRDNAWAWYTHVVCAALAVAGYALHRIRSFAPPRRFAVRRFAVACVGILAVTLIAHAYSHRGLVLTAEAQRALEKGTVHGPGSKHRDLSLFTDSPFVPAGFVPPASPFFPSAATTTTGDFLPDRIITRGDRGDEQIIREDLETYGFVVRARIGAETCYRCHPDTVEQWAASAHRFSSFNNPFYEASVNLLRETGDEPNDPVLAHLAHYPDKKDTPLGMIKSKWCAGCHDPALMLPGSMDRPIDRTTPEAQAGLTCLACHAIDHIHNVTGNGNYNIADEQEDPYIFATSENPLLVFLHDVALKAKPTVHKRQLLKPFFRTAEFCATCHKVSLDVPVNSYRWLRGQDEYDNWHDSGVARNASRTFYLPPTARRCQDCHMPLEPAPLGDVAAKDGMVRSHRFLAVNTALPFIRGDTETIERAEKFLRDAKLRIDVFALRREREGASRTIYALDRTRPPLVAGETVTLDVVVRNLGVGHTFPGGTNDSNEGWIEFTLLDETGRVLVQSGGLTEDRQVDPWAHMYNAVFTDRFGRRIRMRNAQSIYALVYANVIGPGTADVAHYRFTVPPELAGRKLTARARLLWRKFDRPFTEFAYRTNPQGFRLFDDVPDLPITEIARHEVTFEVRSTPDDTWVPDYRPLAGQWVRFNDYGIASLLEGDTVAAQQAFALVADLVPERVDGYANQARVAIRDGALEEAYRLLARAEELAPNNPQLAWFWGVLLQEDGRYEEAANAYRRVLQAFPADRAAWRNLGRVLYLSGEFEGAIQALDEALRIDPEDRIAHYHRMLALRALGRHDEARVAEAAYRKYKLDESAEQVTRIYRLQHPEVQRMSQAINVYHLEIDGKVREELARTAAAR